jgi:hypothetical protein
MFDVFDNDFKPFMLNLGYNSIMQKKINKNNQEIGNAIFYKENKFIELNIEHRSRILIVTLKYNS